MKHIIYETPTHIHTHTHIANACNKYCLRGEMGVESCWAESETVRVCGVWVTCAPVDISTDVECTLIRLPTGSSSHVLLKTKIFRRQSSGCNNNNNKQHNTWHAMKLATWEFGCWRWFEWLINSCICICGSKRYSNCVTFAFLLSLIFRHWLHYACAAGARGNETRQWKNETW